MILYLRAALEGEGKGGLSGRLWAFLLPHFPPVFQIVIFFFQGEKWFLPLKQV